MNRNKVVLVNENDMAIGEMDKLEAHIKGVLHRAFSVFIFNENGEMLIHQRAEQKYHGGGLWTNACCSHPQLGEDIKESALERLQFEMGLHCDLESKFSFLYKVPVENNLIEHEFDYVFTGITSEKPKPNSCEVQSFQWICPKQLQKDIQTNPHHYTFWFRKALPILMEKAEKQI
ncbi:MAG: isopentenyl-diphosphate Delta-isomerase [Cyclobacteriaceae bacterium]|nr:isopentenyl-diphosphate Delta-isomerase [Cyclobacteriaceae bacterium]